MVEIPGPRRFDLNLLKEDAIVLGLIVLLDSVHPSEFKVNKFTLQVYRQVCDYYELPYIVVSNKQDYLDAWSLEDLQIVFGVKQDEKFLACNAKNRDSVKNVLLELLYLVT